MSIQDQPIKIPTIECVIQTHKRPDNLMPCLMALRQQTRKFNRITVIDASSGEWRPPKEAFDMADRVFPQFGRGVFDRYVPVGAYTCTYTLFVDDDYQVAPMAVERLLKIAGSLESFGVIGEVGRLVGTKRPIEYNFHDIRAKNVDVRPVDTVIRGFLVNSHLLTSVLDTMFHLREMGNGWSEEAINYDDLLLCVAMQRQFESCLVYSPEIEGARLIGPRLPCENAVSSRPDHMAERTNFLRMAYEELGWIPL